MAVARPPEVLVFGHSFVRRLAIDIYNPLYTDLKRNFGLDQCNVTLRGLGNLAIHRDSSAFYERVDAVFRRKPFDIVLCQLGGNDISLDLDSLTLAKELIDFGEYLINSKNVKIVYICEIFTRDSPRDISPAEYEIRRTDTNSSLHSHLQHNSRIKLWRHKRIFESPLHIFNQDGIHMNSVGQKKLYKSIRQGIIFAVEDYYYC